MSLRRVMWSVLFLVIQVEFAFSVYLTMTDVELKIPNVINNSQKKVYPVIQFAARNIHGKDETMMKYSLNITGEYMQIKPSSGEVILTPKFIRNVKEIGKISSTAYVVDIDSGDHDKTTLQVNIFPLDELDCDKFVEEICFWTRATYRVEKRSGATVMGSLSSPYFLEMCPYRINYTMKPDENFSLIPPDDKSLYWSVGSVRPLILIGKDRVVLHITCTLENTQGNEKGAMRRIDRDVSIFLLDIDEYVPKLQSSRIDITMDRRTFEKGHIVRHRDLTLIDNDTVKANHFTAKIVGGEELNILKPICKKLPFTFQKEDGNQTAIHCTLEFTRETSFDTPNYGFILQLNDTRLKNKKIDSVVQLPVNFKFPDSPQSLTILKIYPRNTVKILRTAAPMTRVTQPIDIRNCSGFEMKEFDQPGDEPFFNITRNEGIVFVHDFMKLKNSSNKYISLNISWIKENRREYDEIQVRIVDEPNKTCGNMKTFGHWISCAEHETRNECQQEDACAIATGGPSSLELRRGPERCIWRGDAISPNITHLYSTCTPDPKTCPDGICDSLEILNDLICPQDCTRNVLVPLKVNPKTGRGIDEASGAVVCTTVNCSIVTKKGSNSGKKDTRRKNKKHPPITNDFTNNSVIHSNLSGLNENITAGKFGIVIGKCGNVCVMGIGIGILFLAGSIAFIVICYKLGKTNRLALKKNEQENQEMRAPLSISAIGNVTSEPLAFSFNLSTPMDDTTFINTFIYKYKPDPKWEFPRSQLIIMQTLGEGEFGRVLKAEALNISGQTGYSTVAVKTLKNDARESELNDLLSEYQLLKEVSHPNVIRLLGVCTETGGPIYLIIEYAEHGSLRNYLRRSRKLQHDSSKRSSVPEKEDSDSNYDEPKTSDITPKNLLSFAWQISNGMAYLSDIKLVHRDLAARNVLLAADKVCKISDFGLTRDVYEDNAYLKRSKGRVPVKWMAPESLADHIYTTKSDVWSFGILVWELVTLGATPYPGIAVQNLYHLLRQGYRMERPNNCSPALYKIMRSCWNIDPETFHELSKCSEQLLEDKMEYINLSDNAIHNRGYFLSPFENEEPTEDSSIDISPLNLLSRTQSYEKCGAIKKTLDEELQNITEPSNITQGYETPVKFPRKVKTPSNENPENIPICAAIIVTLHKSPNRNVISFDNREKKALQDLGKEVGRDQNKEGDSPHMQLQKRRENARELTPCQTVEESKPQKAPLPYHSPQTPKIVRQVICLNLHEKSGN
ncbi:hypothetical protein JTB14_002471 [Gonioctena quinquepunctata]|nr:hypothetical protein JTB14_002471 [Gonioctena quinquepunctata]